MPTAAKIGYGSKLKVDATGGGTFTDIAEVTNISGPNVETKDVDATNLDSPDRTMEYIPGMREPGEVEFDLNYTKAQADQLYGFGDATKAWKIVLSDNSTWAFSGHIKKFGQETPLDNRITNKVSIKVTGKPVFTPS